MFLGFSIFCCLMMRVIDPVLTITPPFNFSSTKEAISEPEGEASGKLNVKKCIINQLVINSKNESLRKHSSVFWSLMKQQRFGATIVS
jgi:hypothetical protein